MKLRYVIAGLWAVFCIALFGFSQVFTVNTTPSLPRGIYLRSGNTPNKGDIVLFCPANDDTTRLAYERGYISAGFCPGGYRYLIKKMLATRDDLVRFDDNGIYVNGALLVNTRPLPGLPTVRGEYVLSGSESLLASDHNPLSYDARYYGLSDVTLIKSVLHPVLIWDD